MAKYKRGSLTLARRVFNTPQLILSEDLQTIAQFLVNRANGIENESDFVYENKVEVDTTEQANVDLTQEEQLIIDRKRLGVSADGKVGTLDIVHIVTGKQIGRAHV